MQSDLGRILLFIPTYNERENVSNLLSEFKRLNLQMDFLFLDDNSPDGTGEVLDQLKKTNPKLSVIHRTGKLGIGTAHQEGIKWAYEKGYDTLITMDADFTHPPEYIPTLMEHSKDVCVVVGSRHMQKNSLAGWNPIRKIMTKGAHFMTTYVLDLKYDSTGAFRLYKINKIPQKLFSLIESKSYSFFFESLFVIHHNGFSIAEIPIHLPPREAGSSKMNMKDVVRSVSLLFELKWKSMRGRKSLSQLNPAKS